MLGGKSAQYAGSVQEIVHQRIDCDHLSTDLLPQRPVAREQQAGQAHHQHLVRDPVNIAKRTGYAFDHASDAIWTMRLIGLRQLAVYPGNQVTIGHISDEQKQGIGDLVQAPVA